MPYIVTDPRHPNRDEENEIALVGDLWWKRPFKIHRNIGATDDSVVCLQSFKKKCPICEYRAKLIKEGKTDEDTQKSIKDLKPSDRVLYCVIPLNAKKDGKAVEVKPHLFDISYAMFGKMLKKELEENPEKEVFPDIEEGITINARFDGTTIGKGKPFAECSRIDFIDREEPYKSSMIDKIPNLDNVLKQYSYEELERKFYELEDEDTDEKEEPVRKKKVIQEEESEPEEPPVRKKKVIQEEESEPEEPVRRKTPPLPPKKKVKPERAVWSELSVMKMSQLIQYVQLQEIDLDPDDFEDDPKSFRKAIADAQGTIILPKAGEAVEPSRTANKDYKPAKKQIEAHDDEDPDDDLPVKGTSKKSSDKCPSGYRFGVDTDTKNECDSCDLWDDCMAEKKKRR